MLFNIEEVEKKIKDESFNQINVPADFISSQDEYLSKQLRKINLRDENKTYHFTSNGRFALHDIVIFCAYQIGNARAVITSFNISDLAAKALVRAWDKRIFTELKFVLNTRKKHAFKSALSLIEGKFTVAFSLIHAKVALIWNDKHHITVVTSGNLSNNNNYERGFISTNKQIFDFDKEWIDKLFNGDD